MTEGQEQRSTEMPWLLKGWPLFIVLTLVTTGLVLLAVFVDSDVTRVAVPAIVGAVGTVVLSVVTVRLSINELTRLNCVALMSSRVAVKPIISERSRSPRSAPLTSAKGNWNSPLPSAKPDVSQHLEGGRTKRIL